MLRIGRGLGVLALSIALVVGVGATAASAARHHHHHHHHHVPSPTPTPVAAGPCSVTPSPITMAISGAAGSFTASFTCSGFAPAEPLTVSSVLLTNDCTGLTLPGATTSDALGHVNVAFSGTGCGTGTYTIQIFGFNDAADFPVTLQF